MSRGQEVAPRQGRAFFASLGWKKPLVTLWLLTVLLLKSNIIPSASLWLTQVLWDSGIGYKLSPISIFTLFVLSYLASATSQSLMNLMARASFSATLTFIVCGVLILGVLALLDIIISYVTGSPDLLILPTLFSLAMGDFNTNITATAGVVNNSINISLT